MNLESPTSTVWKIEALLTTGPLVLPMPAEDGGGVEGAAAQLEQEHPLAQAGGVGEEEWLGGIGEDDDAFVLFTDLVFSDEHDPEPPLEEVWLFDTERADEEGVFEDTTAGAEIGPVVLIVSANKVKKILKRFTVVCKL